MLTVIIILLIFNSLLIPAVGFLIVIALGEFGATEKFRFEFEPIISSDNTKPESNIMRNFTKEF